ncbi:glycosyltransferase family 2 protein [Pseudoalteromonas sp.]|uniref:glycosyltransferase n=1 Tax=Pseudoalteromonas sp. TaxID=53249 RepID=UPI003568DD1F
MSDKYVVISPCRNEEKFMRETLDSVVNQSVKPSKWIIVDDGSTDNTPKILEEYAKKFDFIEVVTRENRGHRSVGPGVVDAFYAGFNTINLNEYDYICKLDLDLIMPERYFELMMAEMKNRPRLGTFSGKAYYYGKNKHELISEGCGDESSIGATKFYRTACFKQIGGFVRQVMWDGIDSHRCRLLGWISESRDDEETRFIHLRPMGSSQKGILTGRKRHGFGQYFMGTGWLYFCATIIYRLKQRPFIIGALASFWGYFISFVKREQRLNDPQMVKFMKHYQIQCLLKGKKAATNSANISGESRWDPSQEKYEIPNNEC